jgi:phosphohistidine phosphatase
MSKTVIIVRHAKSSWDDPMLSDFDRTLNERGKRDAPIMAQRLLNRPLVIDGFISSPAKRALSTAIIFAAAFGKSENDIITIANLYHAPPEVLMKAISAASNHFNCIAVFAHNPGITDFVNQLTNAVQVDNVPTCGVFAVKIKEDDWRKFASAKKEFLFFDYPKAG